MGGDYQAIADPDDGVNADFYFAVIPEDLIHDQRVGDGAFRLYALLRRVADWQTGSGYQSRKTLAAKLGISPATLDRRAKELADAGWLAVEPRWRESGDRTSNLYTVRTEVSPNLSRGVLKSDEGGGLKSEATGGLKNDDVSIASSIESQRSKRVRADDGFEAFWGKYPRRNGVRAGKAAAAKLWARLPTDEREAATAALPAYERAKNGFPEDAERYIRHKRWVGLDTAVVDALDDLVPDVVPPGYKLDLFGVRKMTERELWIEQLMKEDD